MQQQPGYPLPDGTLGSDEIVCQLVFLPNRPEYWQAFISSLHYFATWRAWERDEDKRGKDAATNWSEANELTMECWRMTCLQTLQDDVAAILAIMELGQSCCDETDITHGDQYTDRVEDGVGDVPQNIIDSGYATDTSDWAGFDDYKCMISHVIVDQLPVKLEEIQALISQAGPVAGGVAAVAAILAVIFTGAGAVLAFGIMVGLGTASLLYEALIGFGSLSSLATKVETNHDELACAIYNADGDEGALVALNDKIDELFTVVEAVILKNMNLGPTLKALYAGRHDQQDIAEILFDAGYELGDFSCDCDIIELNGWTINFQTDPAIYKLWGEPGCQDFNWPKFNELEVPGGTPLIDGHILIRGYILINGNIDIGLCPDPSRMRIGLRVDIDANDPDYSYPSVMHQYPYNEWDPLSHPTGVQDFRVDWEVEGDWTNVRYIMVKMKMEARYYEIDLDMTTVITLIEVT